VTCADDTLGGRVSNCLEVLKRRTGLFSHKLHSRKLKENPWDFRGIYVQGVLRGCEALLRKLWIEKEISPLHSLEGSTL
jgi:hypothetical protein